MADRSVTLPLGIVVRRTPGVTRWAGWCWRAVAVLPGAGPADWAVLRSEGDSAEYHAGTLPLTLWRTDTEAYLAALSNHPPQVYVILREDGGSESGLSLVCITVSAFEAQDFTDSGEEIVEPVPMPPGLIAWVEEFVAAHHRDEEFIKRRRDRVRTDRVEDGKGDPRIRQMADVYRAPASRKRTLQ